MRRDLLRDELLRLPEITAALAGAIAEQQRDLTVLAAEVAGQRGVTVPLCKAVTEQRRAFTVLATDVHRSMQGTLTLVSDASSAVHDTMASLHGEMSTVHLA